MLDAKRNRVGPSQAPRTEPSRLADLAARLADVRAATERLCEPLAVEDYVVQSMPDASPAKWHLAHTTWFFETFLLAPHAPGFRPHHPAWSTLFNSYYVAAGPRHPRPERGLLTRPTVREVHAYRTAVDEQVQRLLREPASAERPGLAGVAELGLNHEQQHQELILTDLLHAFSRNPLDPAYRASPVPPSSPGRQTWRTFEGGLCRVGHEGGGFAFDNEGPAHLFHLQPFEMATRLVTAGEYAEFVKDGAYRRPELWLSDGWAAVQAGGWEGPLYWEERDGAWTRFTLHGRLPLRMAR
jgi:ergothioneine biosynthesis protein EgtB